jgi:hypothetical protein
MIACQQCYILPSALRFRTRLAERQGNIGGIEDAALQSASSLPSNRRFILKENIPPRPVKNKVGGLERESGRGVGEEHFSQKVSESPASRQYSGLFRQETNIHMCVRVGMFYVCTV